MKISIWMLVSCLLLSAIRVDFWLPCAMADTTLNGTQTGGAIKSPTSGQLTTPVTQQKSEKETEDLNKDGQQQASTMGMMAIAAGTAMIAAGMAQNPPNAGLIAAGAALVAAGMLGLAAAAKMGANADKAAEYNSDLSNITGTSPLNSNAKDNGIKIDPNLLRNGKTGAIFDDLEKKTGLSREDFTSGITSGASVKDLLAGSPKKFSASQLAAAEKGLSSANGDMSASEMMDKMGLSASDLGTSEYANTGGNANKNAAAAAPSFEGLFGKPDVAAGSASIGAVKVSDEVQAALDQNGITSRSIFEMVHTQYKKKTPQMFGIMKDKSRVPASTENPFGNLDTSNIEL